MQAWVFALHVVMLRSGRIVVSHAASQLKPVVLTIVDDTGTVIHSYNGPPNQARMQILGGLAVNDCDNVFLADQGNSRIKLLSSNLGHIGYVAIKTCCPRALHFDEVRRLLYFGEVGGRLLISSIIISSQ